MCALDFITGTLNPEVGCEMNIEMNITVKVNKLCYSSDQEKAGMLSKSSTLVTKRREMKSVIL